MGSTTGFGGMIRISQPSKKTGSYWGGQFCYGLYNWNFNRNSDPEHAQDWTFKGETDYKKAAVIVQSSGKDAYDNYKAFLFGVDMTEENSEGGWIDEIHYKSKRKYTRLFLGGEWVAYRNEDKHVGSQINIIAELYVPLAQTRTVHIDGVKQEKLEKLSTQKIYLEAEVSLLSFGLTKKSAGFTISPHISYTHEGKATNIWGLGVVAQIYFDYNPVVKIMYKMLVNPADEDATNTRPFGMVLVDVWNGLKAIGIPLP